jgi:streptomycin 6-kinase
MINPAFAAPLLKWGAVPDGPGLETLSSWLLPVRLVAAPAMLKVFKPGSDEQGGADYLNYVDGQGAVRVLASDDASLLMERAAGTRSLEAMALGGKDMEAAEILAGTITELHRHRIRPFPPSLVTLDRRFESLFARAAVHSLLDLSASVAASLLANQRDVLPLHGDMHHANVLDGGPRGWLAIDPKGLIGERTYEVANLLCNPWPHNEIVHDAGRMSRLAKLYAARLRLDPDRVLAYALAHAGLAASWDIDDGLDPWFFRCLEILASMVTSA